jgi:Cys-tRNA(Pro) deacylase
LSIEALDRFIHTHAIQARILYLSVPTPTVETAADALHTTPDRIVKSLLFIVEGLPVLVISPGKDRVDPKKLARHFNVGRKKVLLADPETVLSITGYEVGAVPPFGHRQSVAVVLEQSIFDQDLIFAGGGSMQSLVEVAPNEILRVTGATILDLQMDP